MINVSPSRLSSASRRNRKLAAAIEGLEPRAYLSSVVFGNPKPPATTGVSSGTGFSPVYVNLDDVLGTQYQGRTVADLIVANSSGSTYSVSILPGNGDGTFGTANTISLTISPLTIRTGVLTQNGLTDIVVGSPSSDQFCVIDQTSAGQFTPYYFTATGLSNTQSIAIGNFGGSLPGVAVASIDPGTSDNVAVFLNNTQAGQPVSFQSPQILSVPHAYVASITGYTAGSTTDLAVADSVDNEVTTLINNGSGTFSLGTNYSIGSGNTDPVTITDGEFDQSANTNDDLVTANATSGSVSVLLGNGDGTFQSSAVTTAVAGAASGGGPLKVRVATLTSGGLPGIFCLLSSGSSGDAEVLLGNGNGTFHVGNLINTGSGPYSGIAAGDLNGDGLTDMVLSNSGGVTSLINDTNQDTSTPTAAINTSQVTASAGAATIDFNVTYTDSQQIDTSTLATGNLTVTTPSGGTETATLVSTGLTPSASVTAEYSIPAQGNSASAADDGTYTVTANANSVMNAGGVAVAAGTVGTFAVTVSVNLNGPNLVTGPVTVNNPVSAVAGARFAGATRVTILNSGNATAKGKIVIDLYALPSTTIPSGTPPVESVTRNINLKPGKKVLEVLAGFKWPATAGTDFVVADVNATQSITETTYADNIAASAKTTIVASPFVDIDNIWTGKLPATLKAGRRTPLAVALKNLGNVTARNTATYTVQAEDASDNLTTIGSGTVRVAATAGGRTAVSIPVTVPDTLASGTYHIVITVSYPGDTDTANNSATSSNTITV